MPHQKYTDETCTKVAVKGHAHSFNLHWYRKVNGVWKFAGLNPDIRWFEYDFDKVFAAGRHELGDKDEALAEQASGMSTMKGMKKFDINIIREAGGMGDPLLEQANALAIATGIPPKA